MCWLLSQDQYLNLHHGSRILSKKTIFLLKKKDYSIFYIVYMTGFHYNIYK